MALVDIGPGGGILVAATLGQTLEANIALTQTAMDAAGESTAYIGHLWWDDGLQHVVSSAGGKIYWMASAVGAFANASTTIRVGIQDVTSGGLEDGTFDVHDDLVGGTDTITANAIHTVTMTTGSKTIAHKQLVAVTVEMVSRGGADSVSPSRISFTCGLPYCTTDTGAGPAKVATMPNVVIEADDGAIGYFGPSILSLPRVAVNTSFNSGSTPDEYAMLFQVPFPCAIDALIAFVGEIDAAETGNLHLYTDPTGTPVPVRTVALTPEHWGEGSSNTGFGVWPMTEYTLDANRTYAIAYEATTTGNRNVRRITGYGPSNARKLTLFGTSLQGGTRSNGSGAFTATSADWPVFGFRISRLDNGVGLLSGRPQGLRPRPFAPGLST